MFSFFLSGVVTVCPCEPGFKIYISNDVMFTCLLLAVETPGLFLFI